MRGVGGAGSDFGGIGGNGGFGGNSGFGGIRRLKDLVASFPAAGSGGTTLEQLAALTVRRGMGYVALANPPTIDALESGLWLSEAVEELRGAIEQQAADRVILFGHCMGGLSAIRMAAGLESELALPVALLVVNAPCPDDDGRIPTMTEFSDAQIAEVLAHDGFPQELLDDEDLLEEIADGLRADARVADRLAEWVSRAGALDALHVLSTRGDMFIPPEQCSGWRNRVSRSFHLSIVEGGHALDESVVGALEAAVDGVLAELADRADVADVSDMANAAQGAERAEAAEGADLNRGSTSPTVPAA